MSNTPDRLSLPTSLQNQLHEFRRNVWIVKSIEALAGAFCGVLVAYLVLYTLDRFIDTPRGTRLAIWLTAVIVCGTIPVSLHRWIWRHRSLDQLSRLISRRFPSLGDQLTGVIELARNPDEQHRSPALVAAAIQQVATETSRKDLATAIPRPRHRQRVWLAAIPAVFAIALLALYPGAAANAWMRFVAPWTSIERYTFTRVNRLPHEIVVPHGEATNVNVALTDQTRHIPAQATISIGLQETVRAPHADSAYAFAIPGQIDSSSAFVRVGDYRQSTRVTPMLRPELTHIKVDVTLPEYLHRPDVIRDVRGGVVALVKGSTATFAASANRELKSATVDGEPTSIDQDSFTTPAFAVDHDGKKQLQWTDNHGLQGAAPFQISISARDDEAPTLVCENLPRQKIVLDSETLTFKINARDDFGIKAVGFQWSGLDANGAPAGDRGERTLAAGGYESESLAVDGVFSAKALGIEPQPIQLRLYVEDYLPGRARSYSSPITLYVLTPDEHAIWLTEQLSKWHRQSLEVRDRELQLHHTNQELRMLPPEELDLLENRQRIEAQAAAERGNGRRLGGLVQNGEELVRQAMKNPDFGVGHLEKWAETLQILKDISNNRMPNVADLLKKSAQAPQMAGASKPAGPTAGKPTPSPGGTPPAQPSPPKPAVPSLNIGDAALAEAKPGTAGAPPSPSKSKPRLTLPSNAVMTPPKPGKPGEQPPASETLDEAVVAQQDLLAEFEKIADELNKVLANLEGTTLVKRLKAASREQTNIAGKLAGLTQASFGQEQAGGDTPHKLTELAAQEAAGSDKFSTIMDDTQAYLERRQMQRFKTVLDDMKKHDAVGGLRQLGDDVPKEVGMSIAQAEFWADTFDRWADDLVDPACCGKCPGCKSKSSLPPSIILEAMQILEGEVGLRDETRVAEQASKAVSVDEHARQSRQLSKSQDGFAERVSKLADRIRELPDGASEFGKEIALLGRVRAAMDDATGLLAQANTGRPAIAAETEAIELLLQSKKINPKGGGGGGSNPGGGGTGTTNDAAIALIGTGQNPNEVREDHGIAQSTGESGKPLPEEFRAGLDEYFNRLDRPAGAQ